jgi:hypothetical protein
MSIESIGSALLDTPLADPEDVDGGDVIVIVIICGLRLDAEERFGGSERIAWERHCPGGQVGSEERASNSGCDYSYGYIVVMDG